MCSHCSKLIKAIDDYIAKKDSDLVTLLKNEGYLNADKIVVSANELEEALAEALREQCDELLSYMEISGSLEEFYIYHFSEFKRSNNVNKPLSSAFQSTLTTFTGEMVDTWVKSTDSELNGVLTVRTTKFIEGWSSQLGDLMKLNSEKELESVLKKGIDEGLSIRDITKLIQESGIRDDAVRARSTALTEVLRANSFAQQEAFSQSPAVTQKEWIHTGAGVTPRENHVDMNGQIVPVNSPFVMYGIDGIEYAPMYPRDISLPASEVINCHCLSRGIVDEAVLGFSLEERQAMQQEALAAMELDLI